MVSGSQSTPLCDLWTCYFWWTQLFIFIWVREINPVIPEQEEKSISDCIRFCHFIASPYCLFGVTDGTQGQQISVIKNGS